jgi:hypothetical protein
LAKWRQGRVLRCSTGADENWMIAAIYHSSRIHFRDWRSQ